MHAYIFEFVVLGRIGIMSPTTSASVYSSVHPPCVEFVDKKENFTTVTFWTNNSTYTAVGSNLGTYSEKTVTNPLRCGTK
jgi:hypothetical protein